MLYRSVRKMWHVQRGDAHPCCSWLHRQLSQCLSKGIHYVPVGCLSSSTNNSGDWPAIQLGIKGCFCLSLRLLTKLHWDCSITKKHMLHFFKFVVCLHFNSFPSSPSLTALAMGPAWFLLYLWFHFCGFVSDQTQTFTWPNHQWHFESRNDIEGCLFTKRCLNINLLKIEQQAVK